ncbi:MAG TPA: hemerythrin domain-containing protein [Ferruginibacter sp.]|nr:hemerythrin domain-containing protein [Ferruginibacter sp.]
MLRYNIFNMIHKALRAMLYDTALTLQQTYFADTAETAEALEKLNSVIVAFEQHGHHEDSILMPLIEKFQRATIASFEQEHIDDRRMGDDLVHLQNIYHAAQSTQERIIAGSAITKAYGDYMIFNLQHMQREEVELNKLLWNYFTDNEIKMINAQIVAVVPPEAMAQTTPWFMQAINSEEAINWLTEVKEKAPAPVFASLFELTETYLPERIRTRVQDAVLAKKIAEPIY